MGDSLKEAVRVEVTFSLLRLFLLWSFFVSRVRQSPGKPATRKRCVLFHCCDSCCYEGTKINDLSSQQREKPVRHFKIPCRNTQIFASVWHPVSACSYIQLALDLVAVVLVVTVILIVGLNTKKLSIRMFTKIFPWFFCFRLKTSQLLKTMTSLMKVTSYKLEMTTRSTSWRS